MTGPILGADGISRCPWASGLQLMIDYHDDEWGRPVHGEQALYERLCLEGFQAGLSWRTILTKRPAFRDAFADFDPDVVATFSDADLERLLTNDGIIRSRAKIAMARNNALATIRLRAAGGLDEFIWSRQPDALAPTPRDSADVPTQSAESAQLAKDLKKVGFSFIGPTSAFALMEATGVLDTHLVGCHRRS